MNKDGISKYLQPFLYHEQMPEETAKALSPEDAASAVADIFIRKSIRMKGPLPGRDEYNEMKARIKLSTQTGEAIPAIVQFGGSKTFKYCPYPEPDLSEMMAVEQLVRINNEIRRIYQPGLKIRFIIADYFYSYVFGYDESVEPYRSGLEKIIKELGLPTQHAITPVRYSNLIQDFGEDNVRDRCKKNCQLLESYWDLGTDESYRSLIETGWKGDLPQEQRKHYIKRTIRILSKKGLSKTQIESEKKLAVIRFLAYALMVEQFDLLKRSKDKKIIDISFVPLAPGELKTLYKRFRIAPSPPGGTSRSAPPWTNQGILLLPDFRPAICTYDDINARKYTFIDENSVHIGGCSVRSDIYKINMMTS